MTAGINRARIAAVRARLEEMMGTIPSSSGGGGKGGHSDRTGSLAFRQRINPNDPDYGHLADVARRDADELDQLELRFIYRSNRNMPVDRIVQQIEAIVRRWEPLTEAQADGLRTKGDDSGSGWCQSHWRVGSHEPPRTPGSTLCRWCEDWVRALTNPNGEWRLDLEMPPVNMVTLHAQGRRVDAAVPPRTKPARHA